MARVAILDENRPALVMTGLYLERSGHRILLCESRQSVMQQFAELNGEVDLLIADVTFGFAGVVQFGRHLMGESPSLKLLLIAGSPIAPRGAALFRGLPEGAAQILWKPIGLLELLVKVDELIGARWNGVPIFRAAPLLPLM